MDPSLHPYVHTKQTYKAFNIPTGPFKILSSTTHSLKPLDPFIHTYTFCRIHIHKFPNIHTYLANKLTVNCILTHIPPYSHQQLLISSHLPLPPPLVLDWNNIFPSRLDSQTLTTLKGRIHLSTPKPQLLSNGSHRDLNLQILSTHFTSASEDLHMKPG